MISDLLGLLGLDDFLCGGHDVGEGHRERVVGEGDGGCRLDDRRGCDRKSLNGGHSDLKRHNTSLFMKPDRSTNKETMGTGVTSDAELDHARNK